MNHLFQVTVYTGQQLVLEGLQRWLQRPCAEPEQQRARRTGIKGLIMLLIKTAATGVLATILDAAIEYRRRQLLAAAADSALPQNADDATVSTDATVSRFAALSLGPLSRSGIAAWKTRLLVAIDELERQAEHYGIEPTHRFTPSKPDPSAASTSNNGEQDVRGKVPATAALSTEDDGDLDSDEARQAALAKTIEQLQDLVKQGDDESERSLEVKVDMLLDSLLGTDSTAPGTPGTSSPPSGLLRSSTSCAHLSCSSRSSKRGSSADLSAAAVAVAAASASAPCATAAGGGGGESLCYICMDRTVKVQVMGCGHDLCFQCARRLCAAGEHALPQCPFCRQPINGFSSSSTTSTSCKQQSAVATTIAVL